MFWFVGFGAECSSFGCLLAVLTWALQFLVFGWVRCFLCADLVLAGGLVIWWLVGIADYWLWLISCLDVWMV